MYNGGGGAAVEKDFAGYVKSAFQYLSPRLGARRIMIATQRQAAGRRGRPARRAGEAGRRGRPARQGRKDGRDARRGLYLSVCNTRVVPQCARARALVRVSVRVRCRGLRRRRRRDGERPPARRRAYGTGRGVHSILQQPRSGCLFSACRRIGIPHRTRGLAENIEFSAINFYKTRARPIFIKINSAYIL